MKIEKKKTTIELESDELFAIDTTLDSLRDLQNVLENEGYDDILYGKSGQEIYITDLIRTIETIEAILDANGKFEL